MLNKSQEQKVKEQLKENGYVSRNWALRNYISRLGAIIFNLKQQGYNLQGKWHITEHGKDFRYYQIKESTQEHLFEPRRIVDN